MAELVHYQFYSGVFVRSDVSQLDTTIIYTERKTIPLCDLPLPSNG